MIRRLLLLLLALQFQGVKAEVLNFATDAWCPYICDVNSERPGILVEATNQILRPTEYLPEYITINWAQSINLVRKGELDGLIGTYQSDAPDFIYGTQAFLQSQMCFIVSQSSDWQFDTLLSLDKRQIAFMNGYSYGALMDNYILNNENSGERNLMRISGDEDIRRRVRLLRRGRIDTIIEDIRVFKWFAAQASFSGQFKSAGCLAPEDVYIGFSPSLDISPKLAALLDKGIQQLKQNGQLQRIINSYGDVDVK